MARRITVSVLLCACAAAVGCSASGSSNPTSSKKPMKLEPVAQVGPDGALVVGDSVGSAAYGTHNRAAVASVPLGDE